MPTYRGFFLHRSGRDWYWIVPTGNVQTGGPRTRWGTLAEIRADIDAYLAGMVEPGPHGCFPRCGRPRLRGNSVRPT
jgi:hypothetical protein